MGSEPKYQAGIYIIVVSCDTRERIIIIIVSGPAYDLKNRPEILGEACRRPNRDNGPESLRDRRNGKRPVRSETRKWSRVVDRSIAHTFASIPQRELTDHWMPSKSLLHRASLSSLQNLGVIIMDKAVLARSLACLLARGTELHSKWFCMHDNKTELLQHSKQCVSRGSYDYHFYSETFCHTQRDYATDNLCKICARDFCSRFFYTYARGKGRGTLRSGFFARDRKTIWKRQCG